MSTLKRRRKETEIDDLPRKPWTRLEWTEKKKAIARDLAEVINRHGFDNHFDLPDFILADIALVSMYEFSNFRRKVEDFEFGQVIKKHEEWDGTGPHPYGCDQEYEDNDEETTAQKERR